MTYASHVWPGYEFIFLSRQLGILDTSQVLIKETTSATSSLDLIVSGEVDAAALTLDEVIKANSLGQDLSIVAVFDISAGADMLIGKTNSKDLTNLKGKKIGVETSALGALVLSQVLEKSGLTHQDINVVNLTIDEQEKAWDQGNIDSVITYEPVASKLINKNGFRLFDSREMPEMILDVLVVRSDALDKTEQIEHLLQSHFSAQKHFEIQRQDALYRMAPRLGVDPEDVPSLFEGLLLPNLDNNKRLMLGNESIIEQRSKKIQKILFDAGLISSNDNLNHIVHSEFIEKL